MCCNTCYRVLYIAQDAGREGPSRCIHGASLKLMFIFDFKIYDLIFFKDMYKMTNIVFF